MKVKEIIEILKKLELDNFDVMAAKVSLEKTESVSRGLLWIKVKGRLFYHKKIARQLKWEDNRLVGVAPSLKKYDIAPMNNITCNGDNILWVETPEGGRPDPDCYMSKDRESEEFKQAVASCYWKKGYHPRSKKAREAWYLRNSGEFEAYSRGEFIDPRAKIRVFVYEDSKIKAKFINSGLVWQVEIEKKIVGKVWVKIRKGFEIDNVIREDGVQNWFPIPGYELKAPVTNSTIPFWRKER